MPPKSKRRRAFEEAAQRAREGSKRQKLEQIQENTQQTSNDGAGPSSQSVPPTPTTSLNPPAPRERSVVTPMGSEMSEDSTFDPERELRENNELKMEKFCGEWVASLDRDDRMSLGIFLSHHLENLVGFSKLMAAEYSGMMLSKSERTIRQWRADFAENGYEVPDNQQGR